MYTIDTCFVKVTGWPRHVLHYQ